jgi:3-oxoacyl-[acyl-carrier protein] reductase
MNLELADRCCLVAGGSRGIGRSIALALAAEGAKVVVVARGEDDLRKVATELTHAGGGPHATACADVTTVDGAAHAITSAVHHLGALDVVVANVGKSFARTCHDMDDDDFTRSLEVNLRSAQRIATGAIPHLTRRGGGSILLISSIWGREAGGAPGYNVAKAGVIALAKAMARDYAAHGIRVNSLAPGSVLFPGGGWERRQKADPAAIARFVERELPFGRFGSPEEIADVAVFLSSARARWISGACSVVDGAQSRAF